MSQCIYVCVDVCIYVCLCMCHSVYVCVCIFSTVCIGVCVVVYYLGVNMAVNLALQNPAYALMYHHVCLLQKNYYRGSKHYRCLVNKEPFFLFFLRFFEECCDIY